MTINVDDVLSDADLDEFLGGQVTGQTTLLPVAWANAKPAREYALAEVLRLLKRAHPSIRDTDVDLSSSSLKRAVLLGASARLYQLAISTAADASLFYAMEKRYLGERNDEIRALGDAINAARAALGCDTRGRGRRSVSLVRR